MFERTLASVGPKHKQAVGAAITLDLIGGSYSARRGVDLDTLRSSKSWAVVNGRKSPRSTVWNEGKFCLS